MYSGLAKSIQPRVLMVVGVALILGACSKQDPETVRKRLHLPKPGFVGNAVLGKGIYQSKCLSCHGIEGRGIDQGPPLVHKTYKPGHHPDTAFHLAVKNGVRQHHWHFGHMPPVEGLTPEEVEHVVAYIRQEQRRAGIQ